MNYTLSLKTRTHSVRLLALMLLISLLFGCSLLAPPVEPAPPPPPPTLSAKPIDRVSEIDIRFAQKALNQLGYKAGYVDGLWGPRSAKAIRAFEAANNIKSANGRLSELNLTRLSEASSVKPEDVSETNKKKKNLAKKPQGIETQLDPKIPVGSTPQLIIVEKPYELLAKPNPYSEVIAEVRAGNGVYILGLQEGWYEVESLAARQRGYIPHPGVIKKTLEN